MAKKLQLLRNNTIYGSHKAALAILNDPQRIANRADGEILLARYVDEEGKIQSILGIVAITEEGSSLTIVDVAKIEGELGETLTESVNGVIDGSGLGENGVYTPNQNSNFLKDATSLMDADAKLDAAIKKLQEAIGSGGSVDTQIGAQIELALETLDFISSETGDYVASVSQSNGIISATMGTLKVKDVKSGDKFLSAANGELSSTISVKYDETNKKIQLLGIGNEVVSEIDATAFIKDGMVNNVQYDAATSKVTITFNTDSGKEPIEIDLSNLINTYTAGKGLSLNGSEFSVKFAENDMLSFNENNEIVVSDTWDCGSYD